MRFMTSWARNGLLGLLVAAMLSACGGVTPGARGGPRGPHPAVGKMAPRGGSLPRPGALANAEGELVARYRAAISDAAVFRPEHQVKDLVTIDGPVHVVSWQTCDCATCAPCLSVGSQVLIHELWVTAVPQVQEACRQFPADRQVLSMQQLLGLPPVPTDPAKTFVLELAVDDPQELFRACTNPDPAASGPCTETFPDGVSADHVEWMADQMLSSWQIPDGYPWTRLGYTYNWNPDAPSIVGPSEFLIRPDSVVTVTAVVPTDQYCAP